MSCVFTCDACKKTATPEYRDGKYQHPEGWWTRHAKGADAGFVACSQKCTQTIDARERAWPKASRAAAA